VFWGGEGGGKSCPFYQQNIGELFFPSVNLSNFTKFVGKKLANFFNKKLGRKKKE
jgi:hypothetical protein